jgi:hypothetical protein
VLRTFVSREAALGMPADAGRVITVGAAGPGGERPFSTEGSPLGQTLRAGPTLLAADEGLGTAGAACFAAGVMASAHSAGVPLCTGLMVLDVRQGALLRVPACWPRR